METPQTVKEAVKMTKENFGRERSTITRGVERKVIQDTVWRTDYTIDPKTGDTLGSAQNLYYLPIGTKK